MELCDDSKDLGTRIVQAMDEHDSLLQVLLQKGSRADEASATASSPSASMSGSTASYRSGGKVPKGDKTIIEELQVSNEQLRILVEQLVNELAALRTENERLNHQVADLMNDQSSNLTQLPPLEQPQLLY